MLNDLTTIRILVLFLIMGLNIHSFFLFYRDKRKAQKKQYRIPERTLIFSAFLAGGIGAWFGMTIFRHKTKHLAFKISMPIAMMLTVFIIFVLFI
ncbi:MAG TPA: DUF1294 domain-containing protein [Atopostipes sp.]|nr:DUF1294 domain-containing protein [Atopostipes sp.]